MDVLKSIQKSCYTVLNWNCPSCGCKFKSRIEETSLEFSVRITYEGRIQEYTGPIKTRLYPYHREGNVGLVCGYCLNGHPNPFESD